MPKRFQFDDAIQKVLRDNIDPTLKSDFLIPVDRKESEVKVAFNIPEKLENLKSFLSGKYGKELREGVKGILSDLQKWADDNNINSDPTALDKFYKDRIDYLGTDEGENAKLFPLFNIGVPLLAKLVDLLKNSEMQPLDISLDRAKAIVKNLFQELVVCGPGVYTNIRNAYSQFVATPQITLMDARKNIASQIIVDCINEINAPRLKRLKEEYDRETHRQYDNFEAYLDEVGLEISKDLEIHYVNGVLNFYGDLLGIDQTADYYIKILGKNTLAKIVGQFKDQSENEVHYLVKETPVLKTTLPEITRPTFVVAPDGLFFVREGQNPINSRQLLKTKNNTSEESAAIKQLLNGSAKLQNTEAKPLSEAQLEKLLSYVRADPRIIDAAMLLTQSNSATITLQTYHHPDGTPIVGSFLPLATKALTFDAIMQRIISDKLDLTAFEESLIAAEGYEFQFSSRSPTNVLPNTLQLYLVSGQFEYAAITPSGKMERHKITDPTLLKALEPYRTDLKTWEKNRIATNQAVTKANLEKSRAKRKVANLETALEELQKINNRSMDSAAARIELFKNNVAESEERVGSNTYLDSVLDMLSDKIQDSDMLSIIENNITELTIQLQSSQENLVAATVAAEELQNQKMKHDKFQIALKEGENALFEVTAKKNISAPNEEALPEVIESFTTNLNFWDKDPDFNIDMLFDPGASAEGKTRLGRHAQTNLYYTLANRLKLLENGKYFDLSNLENKFEQQVSDTVRVSLYKHHTLRIASVFEAGIAKPFLPYLTDELFAGRYQLLSSIETNDHRIELKEELARLIRLDADAVSIKSSATDEDKKWLRNIFKLLTSTQYKQVDPSGATLANVKNQLLGVAAKLNQQDILEEMIANDANLHSKDSNQRIPLEVAAQARSWDALNQMLDFVELYKPEFELNYKNVFLQVYGNYARASAFSKLNESDKLSKALDKLIKIMSAQDYQYDYNQHVTISLDVHVKLVVNALARVEVSTGMMNYIDAFLSAQIESLEPVEEKAMVSARSPDDVPYLLATLQVASKKTVASLVAKTDLLLETLRPNLSDSTKTDLGWAYLNLSPDKLRYLTDSVDKTVLADMLLGEDPKKISVFDAVIKQLGESYRTKIEKTPEALSAHHERYQILETQLGKERAIQLMVKLYSDALDATNPNDLLDYVASPYSEALAQALTAQPNMLIKMIDSLQSPVDFELLCEKVNNDVLQEGLLTWFTASIENKNAEMLLTMQFISPEILLYLVDELYERDHSKLQQLVNAVSFDGIVALNKPGLVAFILEKNTALTSTISSNNNLLKALENKAWTSVEEIIAAVKPEQVAAAKKTFVEALFVLMNNKQYALGSQILMKGLVNSADFQNNPQSHNALSMIFLTQYLDKDPVLTVNKRWDYMIAVVRMATRADMEEYVRAIPQGQTENPHFMRLLRSMREKDADAIFAKLSVDLLRELFLQSTEHFKKLSAVKPIVITNILTRADLEVKEKLFEQANFNLKNLLDPIKASHVKALYDVMDKALLDKFIVTTLAASTTAMEYSNLLTEASPEAFQAHLATTTPAALIKKVLSAYSAQDLSAKTAMDAIKNHIADDDYNAAMLSLIPELLDSLNNENKDAVWVDLLYLMAFTSPEVQAEALMTTDSHENLRGIKYIELVIKNTVGEHQGFKDFVQHLEPVALDQMLLGYIGETIESGTPAKDVRAIYALSNDAVYELMQKHGAHFIAAIIHDPIVMNDIIYRTPEDTFNKAISDCVSMLISTNDQTHFADIVMRANNNFYLDLRVQNALRNYQPIFAAMPMMQHYLTLSSSNVVLPFFINIEKVYECLLNPKSVLAEKPGAFANFLSECIVGKGSTAAGLKENLLFLEAANKHPVASLYDKLSIQAAIASVYQALANNEANAAAIQACKANAYSALEGARATFNHVATKMLPELESMKKACAPSASSSSVFFGGSNANAAKVLDSIIAQCQNPVQSYHSLVSEIEKAMRITAISSKPNFSQALSTLRQCCQLQANIVQSQASLAAELTGSSSSRPSGPSVSGQ